MQNIQLKKIVFSGLFLGLVYFYLYLRRRKKRQSNSKLDHEKALYRSETIQNIQYKLLIKLQKKHYEGVILIYFDLKSNKTPIFLDFKGKKINYILINDFKLSEISKYYDGENLDLPLDKLNIKSNKLCIYFENTYTNNGQGLCSFLDTDNHQYIYSNLEPNYCHSFFPCFDQPNIKLCLELTVMTYKEWTVISNEFFFTESTANPRFLPIYYKQFFEKNHEIKIFDESFVQENDNYRIWVFNKTTPLPSYLFSLLAGDYSKITYGGNSSVQIELYCRKKLLTLLRKDSNEIFEVIIKGLSFYESLFKIKYPFSKYTQIFVPELFNYAMENPGSITFDDSVYLFEERTLKNKFRRNYIILHEMVHNWFGNLITMEWWDDIWLNENFAEFFAFYGLEKISFSFELPETRIMFHWNKFLAYIEDNSGSNSIVRGINYAEETDFDVILYCKGSSMIYELFYIMGEKKFIQSIQEFLKKYQWKNANINNFCRIFRNNYLDIDKWMFEFMTHGGHNNYLVVRQSKNILIKQKPLIYGKNIFKRHLSSIAIYYENCNYEQIEILIENKEYTEIRLNEYNYEGVLLNCEDRNYMKIELDTKSFVFFNSNNNFKKIKNNIHRIILWKCFFDMINELKYSPIEFLNKVFLNIIDENESNIIILLKYCIYVIRNLIPFPYRSKYFGLLFEKILNLIDLNPNLKNDLKTFLISSIANLNHIFLILNWYTDPFHIKFTIKEKWKILIKLNTFNGIPESEIIYLYDEIIKNDTHNIGKFYKIKFNSISISKKENFWKNNVFDINLCHKTIKYQMQGFNHENFLANEDYINYFLDNLQNSYQIDENFGELFFKYLLPKTNQLDIFNKKIKNKYFESPNKLSQNLLSLQSELKKLIQLEKLFNFK